MLRFGRLGPNEQKHQADLLIVDRAEFYGVGGDGKGGYRLGHRCCFGMRQPQAFPDTGRHHLLALEDGSAHPRRIDHRRVRRHHVQQRVDHFVFGPARQVHADGIRREELMQV